MKRANKVITFILGILMIILSLAMIFIYLRLLISGDWLLYDNKVNGFIRYFLRLGISCAYLMLAMYELFSKFKGLKIICNNLYFYIVLLFIMSIIILLFATNYIGIVVLGIMGLYFIFKSILLFAYKR